MPINLSKGQKVDLTKGNPSLKNIMVGLGYKHGVMGSQAASRLGNDIGMREPVFVGNIDESRHHIVDIFLDGIVDGAFAT